MADQRIGRPVEVEREEQAARPQHARDLADGEREIGHVAQAVTGGDDVE